jgi:CRISPR-associated protein Cmr6
MIPLAKDTRASIGPFAERVENRSLLFAKMVLSKSVLHDVERFDDAQRFNVLRATHEGNKVLQEEATSAQNHANRGGPNAAASAYKAAVARALSSIRLDNSDLAVSRIRSNNRFLLDLEASYSGCSVTFVASLGGRLLINMAGGVMENSGLALDRVTGLPYIPGTAVKGITRNFALWNIRNETNPANQVKLLRHALAIFGFSPNDLSQRGDFLWAVNGDRAKIESGLEGFKTDTYKGICSFIAAQPSSERNLRIVAEVLTPHFNNNLRPIFFPAVEAGTEFGFAVICQREPHLSDIETSTLLAQAKTWIQAALVENGIGAKTGAGYGWFQIDPQAEEKRRLQLDIEQRRLLKEREAAEQRAAEELATKRAEQEKVARLAALSPEDQEFELIQAMNDEDFAKLAKNLADHPEHKQRAFFRLLIGPNKETRKRWRKNKPELWNHLAAIAATLKIDLP